MPPTPIAGIVTVDFDLDLVAARLPDRGHAHVDVAARRCRDRRRRRARRAPPTPRSPFGQLSTRSRAASRAATVAACRRSAQPGIDRDEHDDRQEQQSRSRRPIRSRRTRTRSPAAPGRRHVSAPGAPTRAGQLPVGKQHREPRPQRDPCASRRPGHRRARRSGRRRATEEPLAIDCTTSRARARQSSALADDRHARPHAFVERVADRAALVEVDEQVRDHARTTATRTRSRRRTGSS